MRKIPLSKLPAPHDLAREVYSGGDFVALFESGEGFPDRARYTIVAWGIKDLYEHYGGTGDLYGAVRAMYSRLDRNGGPFGGEVAVGIFHYEATVHMEPYLREVLPMDHSTPLATVIVPRNVVIYDNLLKRGYTLGEVPHVEPQAAGRFHVEGPISMTERSLFMDWVEHALDRIMSGDAFQIVISRWEDYAIHGDLFTVYEELARRNQSPYMYFIHAPAETLIGTSPELLVKVDNDRAETHPIAGTRRRGSNDVEDLELEDDMLSDEKERAEHVMLVDLARNDLGKVCRFGTVRVAEYMAVEKYSHVQHIVSRVVGMLDRGMGVVDALWATFPAGTVTGAPKPRAMEIIGALEGEPRRAYAGAVGLMYPNGGEYAIVIRTIVIRNGRARIQAGAGVVHDSTPQRELAETDSKLAALRAALCRT